MHSSEPHRQDWDPDWGPKPSLEEDERAWRESLAATGWEAGPLDEDVPF